MISHPRTRLLIFLGVLIMAAPTALSQTESATVSGRVTDASGSVVPGTEVQLQSTERGTSQQALSNQAGIFSFPSVQPGQYHMTIRKTGFRQIEFVGLVVNVQDHIEKNFQLQVGSVAESVTVTGGAPLVNTEDASVSTVVDRNFAENLPLNGRSFQTLIQLTPGVVLTPSNNFDSGQFSVNGQRPSSNYWMVDGVSANIGTSAVENAGNGLAGAIGGFSAMGGTNSLVSVDAMQEFRIQTSTYAPEFGRTPGGQISIVTRSGSNQFHGTAFDYLRNDVFDANNWFADEAKQPKPEERQNDFGGTFSGPIVKDRTFFFFSYEGLRLRLPQTAVTIVPDVNARQSAPAAIQPFLNAFPLPNGSAVASGTAQFNASFSDRSTLDAYSLKLDHKLNDKLNVSARYNYSPSVIVQRGNQGTSLSTVSPANIKLQTATIGATWSLSSKAVSDLRVNYSRVNANSHNFIDSFGGAVPLASVPLPSPFTTRNAAFLWGIEDLSNGLLFDGKSEDNTQRQINLVDSFSLQERSHSLKFGMDFRRLSPVKVFPSYSQQLFFADVPSADGQQLEHFMTTSALNTSVLLHNLGTFAQDTWRINSRLTITYGFRWDIDFAPSTVEGPKIPSLTGYNINDQSLLALAPPGASPYKTTYGDIAPRAGLAYQIRTSGDWGNVVRAGGGIFYDLASSELGNALSAFEYPFGAQNIGFGGTAPLSPSQAAPPTIAAPTPASPGSVLGFDPHLKLPYTVQWNMAFEQGLGHQQNLSASYIGSVGRRLLQTADFFPANATFNFAQLVTNLGSSEYNALQVQFQRRLSRGLQALASYTWSHSIDTGSAGSGSGAASNLLNPRLGADASRGPSDFDVRHALSAAITYDLPKPSLPAFGSRIFGGWSVQSVIQAHSAPPVNLLDVNFFLIDGVLTAVRPDLVPGQAFYLTGTRYPGGKAFNPAAFTDPPSAPVGPNCPFGGCPTRQGNVPRNFLRGFGAAQWDFSLHRDFVLHEELQLQFRAELFNVLNHPNFGPPNGSFGQQGFGVSNQILSQSFNAGGNLGSGAFSPLYQVGGPRSIQLAMKLKF